MADNGPGEAATPPASGQNDPATTESATSGSDEGLRQQRISGILRGVLQNSENEEGEAASKRYPWYVDAVLGVGLLIAMGGFSVGLFKMYITHAAQQCINECNYTAAIHLLKGNPLPRFINVAGGRDEDPDELLARALYLDAMRKMDSNDVKGGLAELQQIRAGTEQFETAQQILLDNFQPSSTQLTGGVVVNDEVASRR